MRRKENGLSIKLRAIYLDDFVQAMVDLFDAVTSSLLMKMYGNKRKSFITFSAFIAASSLPFHREKDLVQIEKPPILIEYIALRVTNDDGSGDNSIERIARIGKLW